MLFIKSDLIWSSEPLQIAGSGRMGGMHKSTHLLSTGMFHFT